MSLAIPKEPSIRPDPLTVTVGDLSELLNSKRTTSVDLVELYLDQIAQQNHCGMRLNAIISTAPKTEVVERARQLDSERLQKGSRGSLHGIPMIVKDLICTPSLGMKTTCGSYAFKDLEAVQDANMVGMLQRAGAIIIGKANLSELGNMKGAFLTSGWSPVGGQTQSPYVRGGVQPNAKWLGHSTPCGSSSGSAAGVAAGFAPVSIGTETDGSICQPATRAALYAMKATVGTIDMTAIQPANPDFDSAGAMAKTPSDLAIVMETITNGAPDFSSSLSDPWRDLALAYVDPDRWTMPEIHTEPRQDFTDQTRSAMNSAMEKIGQKGAKVSSGAPLSTVSELKEKFGLEWIGSLILHGVRRNFENFMKLFQEDGFQTLEDLRRFNETHATTELPPDHSNQDVIENAINDNMSEKDYQESLSQLRSRTRQNIERCLSETGSHVIIGSADSLLVALAAAAGYPIASVPLGFADFNGRAFGMHIIARAHEEGRIFQVMSAWHATFPHAWMPPPLLVSRPEHGK